MKRSSAIAKGLRAPPVGEFCRQTSASLKYTTSVSHQLLSETSMWKCICGCMYRSNTLQICRSEQSIISIAHPPKSFTDPHLLAISLAPVHRGPASGESLGHLNGALLWRAGAPSLRPPQRSVGRSAWPGALSIVNLSSCSYNLLSKRYYAQSLCPLCVALTSGKVLLYS